jgi:integrase
MEIGEESAAGITEGATVTTLAKLIEAYLQDYDVREFRSENTARGRVAHLRRFFKDDCRPQDITPQRIRDYQVARRKEGAATANINRETSALSRMCRIGVLGWLMSIPTFTGRLRESPPRQGFFEHQEYLIVRKHLPAPYQEVLDFAYCSGWRKHEILNLTWTKLTATEA